MRDMTEYEATIIRQGASTRTADELQHVFVCDMLDLGCELSPWGRDVFEAFGAALDNARDMGIAWVGDDESLSDDEALALCDRMSDVVHQLEAASGFLVVWNDGYLIYETEGLSDEEHDALAELVGEV